MKTINIGKTGTKNVNIDLDVLLRTRLLIQANSGGGKSWLLRRLIEQAFGKIQIIVIDPEGEFPSLREMYDFVLVGEGGETAAHSRTAPLLAHRLLELNASAVCDLFEVQSSERHLWVRDFLDAMINAPKKLWHPVLVIVDEAHVFAPEKGEGESVASNAMIDLVSKGRKRGFCAVFATQRLAKLRKDVTAEMTNRLVGSTFEEADLDRAAKLLSILPSEKHAFFEEMKLLEPGLFYGFGRAISKHRILVHVGEVQTTHPEVGTKKFTAAPPPAPNKIKSLLPKLSDLPQEAEKKIRTEAELSQQVRELQRQLRERPKVEVARPEEVRIEVPVLTTSDRKVLQKLLKIMTTEKLTVGLAAANTSLIRVQDSVTKLTLQPQPRQQRMGANKTIGYIVSAKFTEPPSTYRREGVVPSRNDLESDEHLSGPEQRILDAIAWWNASGIDRPDNKMVAAVAGYSFRGSAYTNPRGRLKSLDLIAYDGSGALILTGKGQDIALIPRSPGTPEEMQAKAFSILAGPETKILKVLLNHYPDVVSNEQCAAEAGYSAEGSAYTNPRGNLKTLGFLTYPRAGHLKAAPFLFLEA